MATFKKQTNKKISNFAVYKDHSKETRVVTYIDIPVGNQSQYGHQATDYGSMLHCKYWDNS